MGNGQKKGIDDQDGRNLFPAYPCKVRDLVLGQERAALTKPFDLSIRLKATDLPSALTKGCQF